MNTPTPVTTQSRFPWRTVARTVFQAIVALAIVLPGVIDKAGISKTIPWVAGALAASATITRIMAMPMVEFFLQKYLPWLAASGDKV